MTEPWHQKEERTWHFTIGNFKDEVFETNVEAYLRKCGI